MEFDRPYSRQEFIHFLKRFLPIDAQLNEHQNIPFFTKTNFATTATLLGSCDTLDLNVYEVKHNSRNDARVGLSKDAFRLIADEGVSRALVIFVPEDSNDNYRFSLVEVTLKWDDKDKIKKLYSNPRRYSYYLGKGVAYYTPNKYLNELGRISSIEDLRNRFSVEVLSKEFYTKLYEWYQWALSKDLNVTFPNNPETEKDDRENINVKLIRLITRLLFVWFIKQKGLVPDSIFDPEQLTSILVDFDKTSSVDGNYYNAILQNLFFATLNCAIIDEEGKPRSFAVSKSGRDTRNRYRYKEMFRLNEEEILNLFAHVPFLNGGLFECLDKPKDLYLDQQHDILYDGFSRNATKSPNGNFKYRAFVPNILFFNDDEKQPGLINLFKQYNFTIEENSPSDTVISLDPELLGRVFENLLAAYNPETQESARKATGSFYTPRPIVDYMVNEAIKNYILSKGLDRVSEETLNILFEQRSIPADWTDSDKTAIINALKQVKILDPACGSGAFPMGALLRIVDTIELLNANELDRYRLKLDIIENCVYGVDIQPIAMLICKLRFFISLICEQNDIDFTSPETNFGINTLPNLETKFVAANTLISADIRNYEDDWTNDEKLDGMKKELLGIRNAHFLAKGRAAKKRSERKDNSTRRQMLDYIVSNAQKPDLEKIATYERLLQRLSDELKQYKEEVWVDETRPVVQTLFGVEEHPDSLFRHDINKKKRDELTARIKTLKAELAKEKGKGEISGFEAAVKQITEWNPYDQNSVSPFFDPEWMFCLKEKFDIVIGNPPYLRIQELRKFNIDLADYLSDNYKSAVGSFDLYVTFVERGLQLVKPEGVMYYIMPVKWTNSSFGKGLRSILYEKSFISSIINFVAYQVFEASTYTGIHCFKQSKSLAYLELDRDMNNNKELQNYLSSITYNDFVNININTSEAWVLTNKKVNTVLEKLNKCPYRLSDIFDKIFQGIATSKDDVYFLYDCRAINPSEIEGYSKYLKKNVVIENGLVKPLLKGEDVHRYEPLSSDRFVIFPYDLSNDKAKLFSEQQIATLFPKGYLYLKECEDELRGREKGRFNNDNWFMFGRGQGINYGGIPKLLAPEISFGGNFMFDSNGQYYSTTTIYGYIKKEDINISYETLLAIMNSRLCWWFLKNTGTVLANGYYRYKPAYLKPMPIPNVSVEADSTIRTMIKNLLEIKDGKEKKILVDKIEQEVFSLYGLNKDEITIVIL